MRAALIYGHPLLAAVVLLGAWLTFRQGFRQRSYRLRRAPPPPELWRRHTRWGPWVTAGFVASAATGLLSSVGLRGWAPAATAHAWAGVVSTIAFIVLWQWGLELKAGQRQGAARHGVLGVIALIVAGLTGVLGISLLDR